MKIITVSKILTVVAISLAMTGCGGGSSSNNGDNPTTAAVNSTPIPLESGTQPPEPEHK